MIALTEFKQALGNLAQEMTEEEILKLRDNQDRLAEILFSLWLEEMKKKQINV